MEDILKEFLEGLVEAEKNWQGADHLIYVTYPIVKDNKLLLRALENIFSCVIKTISFILKFEYFHKRVELSNDSRKNLDKFFNKFREKYGLEKEDEVIIKDIIFLNRKHKESGLEFSGRGKITILDDNLIKYELNLEKMKKFVKISKKLLENANRNFRDIF